MRRPIHNRPVPTRAFTLTRTSGAIATVIGLTLMSVPLVAHAEESSTHTVDVTTNITDGMDAASLAGVEIAIRSPYGDDTVIASGTTGAGGTLQLEVTGAESSYVVDAEWPGAIGDLETTSTRTEFPMSRDAPVEVMLWGTFGAVSGSVVATADGEPVADLSGASILIASAGTLVQQVPIAADGSFASGALPTSDSPDYSVRFLPPTGYDLDPTQTTANEPFALPSAERSPAVLTIERRFAIVSNGTVPTPEPEPTTEPTPEPTTEPTPEPTTEPTPEPTTEPTPQPTTEPTPEPTTEPTPQPTTEPTPQPTTEPTPQPTTEPTPQPTTEPTPEPTAEPTPLPTSTPTPTPSPITPPAPTPVPPITLGNTTDLGAAIGGITNAQLSQLLSAARSDQPVPVTNAAGQLLGLAWTPAPALQPGLSAMSSATLVTAPGIALIQTPVAAMSLEAALMAVQSSRASALDADLAAQLTGVQARNTQIAMLNAAVSAVSVYLASPSDTTYAASVDEVKAAGVDHPFLSASAEDRASDAASLLQSLRTMIDATANSQQMDMLRLQALTGKRNEEFDLMTNFVKKMNEARSSIIGNMRSTPIALGTVHWDSGTVTGNFDLAAVQDGDHHLILDVADAGVTLISSVTVQQNSTSHPQQQGSLAATGVEPTATLLTGAGLLIVGLAAFLGAPLLRRRVAADPQ
ncbi:hypothetical protein ACSS7Z_14055 [Microbacterium sp. A82]|uniref:hypothetical protein n=1 Tax=Microbacterium sp. A82 TaxID=3450452 RepID=UPI003F2D9FFF